jgi:hypothetical protein
MHTISVEDRQKVERAMAERDTARRRFEAAIGTSVEHSAYTRFRAAALRVAAADRGGRFSRP